MFNQAILSKMKNTLVQVMDVAITRGISALLLRS